MEAEAGIAGSGSGWRPLCTLSDIPDGGSRGFGPSPGGFIGLFAVRRGDAVVVYVNSCPHIGVALDWLPDRFLSHDSRHIVCATHGATFDIDSGVCRSGPCLGDRLEAVMIERRGDLILVPMTAGL